MKIFFRRTKAPLMQALPLLLVRLMRNTPRVLLLCPDEESLCYLNSHLWTFHDDTFLAHGTASDKYAEHHPLVLALPPLMTNAPNGARSVLLLLPQQESCWQQAWQNFTQVITVFSALDDSTIARKAWRYCQQAGHDIDYKEG